IESCRHAARILDVSDIGQYDWHGGQILLCTNPTTHVDHVVLVDFDITMQTYEEGDTCYVQNYDGVLQFFLDQDESAFDTGL
ncbi:hypothetical protein C0992_011300, partial [Termitomyces sp. T32_za158]